MESTEQKDAALVHWVVAGTFSPAPSGRRFAVTPDDLHTHMAAAGLRKSVTVADRLGAADTRTFDVVFDKPKSFAVGELVASIPALAALRALAEDLGSNDVNQRPLPDAIRQRISDAVGPGKILSAVEALLSPAPAAAAKAEPAKAEEAAAPAPAASVDEILDTKKTAPATTTAVDSFVRAVRSGGAGSKSVTPSAAARGARNLIEEAVFRTANEILAEPSVARWESAWRGLKMLVDQCGVNAGMTVEVVDTDAAALPDAVFEGADPDASNQPDAYFIVDAIDDVERLTALAQAAEGALAPFVVAVSPSFFGAADAHEIARKIEHDASSLPETYGELRGDEASRWLCLVANRVVVASEGIGATKRVAFGSPVTALAAMLAASYRDTGAFGRIRGSDGAFKAGGTWELPSGRDAGTSLPTEAFCSINLQNRLAELGVLGIGSAKNADKVVLSIAPTVRSSPDAASLPGQILTGRVVRFGQWVRDQIPEGASAEDVKALFEQAASVFLFPSLQDGAALRAQVGKGADGKPAVQIACAVSPKFAGSPFHMEFELPLKH
ncbi:MAG: type VI secretion system contractile sheath large subunit [Deltaproteobacteria bacterium]|nr:type VI secretion system contractile sheath large subunit [Deltaproteobacteria bacterium]